MGPIAVTGGTGMLGQHLVPVLVGHGAEVRVLSRGRHAAPAGAQSVTGDVLDAPSLDAAFDGADVVIHAASSAMRKARLTEVEGTRNVVSAAARAGAYLVYVSIVGVDRHRFPYYRAKWAAEQVVERSPADWAIQRATQFHDLIDRFLSGPLFPATRRMRFQPVDATEFSERLWELAESRATGRRPDFGGPEVLGIRDLRRERSRVVGRSALLVPVPPVGFLRDFDRGLHLAETSRAGQVTWSGWLKAGVDVSS